MRLNLGLLNNPKDSLRLWSTELRKRAFSSPEEFAYADYDPTPLSASIGSAAPLESSARYFRHGDMVVVEGAIRMTLTGAGIVSITFKLPVFPRLSDLFAIRRPILISDAGLGVVMTELILGGSEESPSASMTAPGGLFTAGTFTAYPSLTYEAA